MANPGEADGEYKEPFEPPFCKQYFSRAMMRKYEPLAAAMEALEETGGKDPKVKAEFDALYKEYCNFESLSNWDGNKYDIVLYGVSGYTGYLMMQYLKRFSMNYTKEKFTFALAGRTPSKVKETRDRELGGTPWADVPVLGASFDDILSIMDLVKSARLIINVAGPYMLTQGEILIDCCVQMGVHYLDISGEIPWSLRVLDLDKYAREKEVFVIPSAASAGGFPDLGVYMLAKQAREEYGEELRKAICYQTGGGADQTASGGTLKTRAAMSSAGDDVRKKMGDPFALGGFIPAVDRNGIKEVTIEKGTGRAIPKLRQEDLDANMARVTQDPKLGIWRGPFVYSYFDTRIVRRSNALLADLDNRPYGRNLNFLEFAMLPPEMIAAFQGGATRSAGVSVEQERKELEEKGAYYKEGEGPPLEDLDSAWVGYMLYAETTSGHELRCSFVGKDGYLETARVAVETAMTILFDKDKLPFKGGCLTPAVACGELLVKRVIASNMKFKMGEWFSEQECVPPPLPEVAK